MNCLSHRRVTHHLDLGVTHRLDLDFQDGHKGEWSRTLPAADLPELACVGVTYR